MTVRGPAAQNNSKNSHGADANDKKDSNVNALGDLESWPDREARHGQQRGSHGKHWREPEDELVRVVKPWGPTRMGPSRACMSAISLRSTSTT